MFDIQKAFIGVVENANLNSLLPKSVTIHLLEGEIAGLGSTREG